MLRKNVYLLYPPGYSGSYINWAINISDNDQKALTVDNPINNSSSKKFGGAGTSHMHTRVPTHQSLDRHLTWVLYNRPTDYRVYIINASSIDIDECISTISLYDPTGVFVNIHNDNDTDISAYGTINCVTKWPTFIDISLLKKNLKRENVHALFDPYNCARDHIFRNWAVKNHRPIFKYNEKINRANLTKHVDMHAQWYDIRNQVQPHEVNAETYISHVDLTNRIFEISCVDVCNSQFINWFDQFMSTSQVSSSYNIEQVKHVHPEYCKEQLNLQWFKSIANWRETGHIDEYLTSHSIIEAHLIMYMLQDEEPGVIKNDQWKNFYTEFRGPDWPDANTESDFFNLPSWVQQEILDFGYKVNSTKKSDFSNWEQLSITELNQIYQNKHQFGQTN